MMFFFPLACADRLEKIGLLVRTRRLERQIRQKDLAAQIGLSTATLGKIESGAPNVEMRSYMAALWYLGLLDNAFQDPGVPTVQLRVTEHRVRLRKVSEKDF